jgi:hypothetical protein
MITLVLAHNSALAGFLRKIMTSVHGNEQNITVAF